MEKRSPFLLFTLALLALPVSAADTAVAVERQADWDKRQAQALVLQRDGSARQVEAESLYEEAAKACRKKFLVNDCLIEAKKLYTQSHTDAKRLENEGKAIERQIKKEQLSDRDQRRAAETPQHEANLQARELETAEQRKEAADLQTAKEAERARKAEEGARRRAADAERLAKKQAQHEAKLAKHKEKAERRAAEVDGEARTTN